MPEHGRGDHRREVYFTDVNRSARHVNRKKTLEHIERQTKKPHRDTAVYEYVRRSGIVIPPERGNVLFQDQAGHQAAEHHTSEEKSSAYPYYPQQRFVFRHTISPLIRSCRRHRARCTSAASRTYCPQGFCRLSDSTRSVPHPLHFPRGARFPVRRRTRCFSSRIRCTQADERAVRSQPRLRCS